jgi:hypothetical protein
MIEENGLRADALVFIPSFGLQQNGQASEMKTKAAEGGLQNPRGKTRRKRGNRLRQKEKTKEENEPTQKNDQRKKSTRGDTPNQKQRRKTENHRSNKNINRCRRRQRPRANQHAGNESEQKDAIGESLLPLMEESSFPSLSLETDNPIDASSSIWLASTHNPEIFQPQHQMDENDAVDESEMDRFSRLGLYQLSSRTSIGHRKLDKPLSSLNLLDSLDNKDDNDHDGNEVKVQESTMQTSRTMSQKDDDQLRISSRKPKWNMDRLRDRWWRTLTRRRLHRELITELERCLKHRAVDLDGDVSESSESSTASDDTYLDLVNTKPPRHDTYETPNQSALHELVQRSPAGSFASQFDVVRDVIDRNDEQALNELLSLHKGGQLSAHLKETKLLPADGREGQNEALLLEKAIHACVEQDKPHLLRIVLKNVNCFSCRDKPSKQESKKQQITPLMVAAELGHSECLLLLLSKQERNSNTISTRDRNGNNVFHYCCNGQGDESVLRLLLKELSGGAKWKQQQLSKTLLANNNYQKTPLHIACEHGQVELIETFLSICSTATLSKMLSMTDDQDQTPLLAAVAANSTDVVICLIMWRGNHNLALRKTPQAPKKSVASVSGQETELSEQHLPSCPLAWAAEKGNLEMILALLQFTDSSGSDYSVTEAISALLRSPALDDIKSEGVRVLIQAGGDPFLDIVPSSGVGKPETAVHVACKAGFTQVLKTLIETGKKALYTRQRLRRRDPKLRQQPESFFQAMEGTENEQMNSALTNALIECLLNGWNQHESNHDKESIFLPSAVTLYKLGAQLAEKDIIQLRASLHAKTYLMDAPCTNVKNRCFVTSFRHYNAESPESLVNVNDIDRSILAHNSQLLYRMAWMKDDIDQFGCYCPWMATDCSIGLTREKPLRSQDRVILVVGDNENFVVHGSVVSQKSAKLASAIRFAQMNEDADDEHRIPKVALDLDPRLCRFMLQHIYHGSLCTGWSSNMDQVCRDMLDLMVIAEEFLCASLIQECEMRLLSSDPTGCFCWSCSKAVRPVSVEDDRFAECMYCVEGPGSLLAESSLLDVLATTQYLEPLELDYHINVLSSSLSSVKCMPASKAWANANNTLTRVKAINSLKDVAIQTILRNFSRVIDSDSFQESVELNNAESPISGGFSHQVLLLQTCLEELFESCAQPAPFGKVKFANQTKSNAIDLRHHSNVLLARIG